MIFPTRKSASLNMVKGSSSLFSSPALALTGSAFLPFYFFSAAFGFSSFFCTGFSTTSSFFDSSCFLTATSCLATTTLGWLTTGPL